MTNPPEHNKTSNVEWVALKFIVTDPKVNTRPIDMNWVARKTEEGFDLDKLGTPSVSQRTGTRYVWLDGQHRGALLREAGFGDELVEVRVFRDLTRAEEAALFIGLNDNRHIQAIYKFLARVTAREEQAVDIVRIVESYGWRVLFGGSDGYLPAVSSLDAVYTKAPWVLDRTIKIITEAWGLDHSAADGSMIRGIGQAVYRHGDDMETDRLIGRLKVTRGGPARFIADAKGLRDLEGGTIPNSVARKVLATYNKGLKPAHRLED